MKSTYIFILAFLCIPLVSGCTESEAWINPVIVGGAMEAPAYVFSDDFNRSNSATVGGPWDSETEEGTSTISILNNQMRITYNSTSGAWIEEDLGGDQTDSWIYFTWEANREGSLGADKYIYHVETFDNSDVLQYSVRAISNASQNWRGFRMVSAQGTNPYYYPADISTATEYPIAVHYKIGVSDGAVQLFVYDGSWQSGTGNSNSLNTSSYNGVDEIEFGVTTTATVSDTSLLIDLDDFIFDDSDPR